MAKTLSTMIPLGTQAPDFRLYDVCSDTFLNLHELKSDIATVIIFLCNHCPYVKHIQEKLIAIAQHYQSKGIRFIAISANDVQQYPQDGPQQMKVEAQTHQYPFPYLYDETQIVAKQYHAACTPDFFVFDKTLHCVYRGRFDSATPGNQQPVTGEDLCSALDNLMANKPINPDQKASLGCNIKWKN